MRKNEKFTFKELREKFKDEIHQEYSSLTGFLAVVIRTLNPLSYKKLAHGPFSEGVRYFVHLVLFSFIVFLLMTVPFIFSFYQELRTETDHLSNFTLAPQLAVDQVIEFEDMDIVVANDANYNDELLLVTQDSIYWRNEVCLFAEFLCFLYDEPEKLDFSRAHDIVEDRDKFSNVLFMLLLLMLPGIFILLFFYLLIKYVLVVGLYFLFGYLYCIIIRYEIGARELFMVTVYSLSVTILVETIFGFYYETYYVPYAISFVLFMICTYLVAEKPFHHFKHPK